LVDTPIGPTTFQTGVRFTETFAVVEMDPSAQRTPIPTGPCANVRPEESEMLYCAPPVAVNVPLVAVTPCPNEKFWSRLLRSVGFTRYAARAGAHRSRIRAMNFNGSP
jgi:hypothetical protein